MNAIKYLVIHTTATPQGRWVSKEDVIRWHTSPRPRGYGWSRAGYNYLILLDGDLPKEQDLFQDNPNCILRVIYPINFDNVMQPSEISFHAGPAWNPISHSICYVGGMSADFKRPQDTRTPKQRQAMEFFIKYFIRRMEQIKHEVQIIGHNQIDNKACPSFFVPCWLQSIGVNSRYIDTRDPYGYKRYFNLIYRASCYGA